MAKYRLCGGLALMPDHDMKLLENMSAKGWHLSGFSFGFFYRFEGGEPHAYDYAVAIERDCPPEAQELFCAGGWELVVMGPGWQIMRAEAGATPLHTDASSEAEALVESRKAMGRTALACALIAALAFMLQAWFSAQGNGVASTVCLMASVAAAAVFVCTFLPFLGYTRTLRKIRSDL